MTDQTLRISIEKQNGAAETFCDGAVTDKAFDFHAVDGWEKQSDAVVQLELTQYMSPS